MRCLSSRCAGTTVAVVSKHWVERGAVLIIAVACCPAAIIGDIDATPQATDAIASDRATKVRRAMSECEGSRPMPLMTVVMDVVGFEGGTLATRRVSSTSIRRAVRRTRAGPRHESDGDLHEARSRA